MYPDILQAPEAVLVARRDALTAAAKQFLDKNYSVSALVFVGSVLCDTNPFVTNTIVFARPGYISTPNTLDDELMPLFDHVSENKKIVLPKPRVLQIERIRRHGDPVTLGPYYKDCGSLVVGRKATYFDPPANRTKFTITTY